MPSETKIIEKEFGFRLNKNQAKDISGLIIEIQRRDKIGLPEILEYLKNTAQAQKHSGKEKFFYIKRALIKLRFPLSSKNFDIESKNVFLPLIEQSLIEPAKAVHPFVPKEIFVENSVKSCWLEKNFHERFPKVPIKYIDHCGQYLKANKFTVNDLKKPLVFIVKENWDFIKPCPCTKEHLACGYWVLNLGFGCPFDCSYCFLQQYANFPGMILPANLEDFFVKFDLINKNLISPIRIGTGEFCDSLALDHITGYSVKLIDYFR
jgi:spore photoproduct lyase